MIPTERTASEVTVSISVRKGRCSMANKLDLYDANKLKDARKKINEVYEYNYIPSTPLCKKLGTILRKLDKVLETEFDEKKYELKGAGHGRTD